ncbi:glutathione S-transferase omega-2 isoform X2 [Callithrix jacchus]|uniref:glutathione S-transferase omega-2 isoform X2 n=1 Tax=Callithrix jacchus TaxID=9483 RepID=UPI0004F00EDC|nr:glutathione S-transferase omega-2 isoform X2 [Callithrix jacchus]
MLRRLETLPENAARALGKGSQPPGPVPEGLIRIYSMRFCPCSHRIRLVLRAKGIRHEVVNINLKNKPEWYYTKHPFGQIPVLETSQCQLIYDSVIACEYLDDAYPGRKLFPYDPYQRAWQKMLLELFCKILEYQNTTFFGGACISMIDYLLWPWFERLDVYGIADCLSHMPALRLWISAMKQDPTVCALLTDKLTPFKNLPGKSLRRGRRKKKTLQAQIPSIWQMNAAVHVGENEYNSPNFGHGPGDTKVLVTGKNSKAGNETAIYHPGLTTSEFHWCCQGSGCLTKCSMASILP